MIATPRVGRVFARAAPTDLRKGFDGLSALVVEHLGRQATSGDLYLFVSRDRLRAKVLWWDGTGLCIHAKRLEQGRFAALWGRLREGQVELSAAELALFLEGCREVGRRPLSPPAVDPNRKLSTMSWRW
jgi:transposase